MQTPLYQMCAAMACAFGSKNVYFEVLTQAQDTAAVVEATKPFVTLYENHELAVFFEHEVSKAISAGAVYSLQMPFTLYSRVFFDGEGNVIGGLLVRDEDCSFVPASEELTSD